MNKGSFLKRIRKNRILLFMLLPATILVVLFNYMPMAGMVVAFKKFNYSDGIFSSPWNGLDNFQFLFATGKIWSLTRNTLLYNTAFIFVGLVFEVGIALLLSEVTNRIFKKFAQGFMFLPYFVSWVVVSTVMLNIFGSNGVLNSILAHFGVEGFSIYNQVKLWPIVLVAVKVWKSCGYGSVVYMAAIAGIDQEMYEASQIDGANIWQRIRYITIPSLVPTILIMTLLAIGNIFRGDFGLFYQLVGSNQRLLAVSDVIDTFVYRSLITTPNIGMSAAAGFLQSILCFMTIVVANSIVKKIDPDYTLF